MRTISSRWAWVGTARATCLRTAALAGAAALAVFATAFVADFGAGFGAAGARLRAVLRVSSMAVSCTGRARILGTLE